MSRRAQYPLERGNAFRDETGDFFEGRALDKHREIVAAAHEIHPFYFRVRRDLLGHPIEALALFGRHLHFDQRLHRRFVQQFAVGDDGVFDDRAAS